jgi:general secretion pathway protein D
VIGGLMRDSLSKNTRKIPVLGDLPVLGFLFRTTNDEVKKSNLLIILTPYVIRNQEDLRKVFERKMQERQEFLDRYFVFEGEWQPPRDYSRTNGLVEDIRQSYAELDERLKMEADSAPRERLGHEPSDPIDLPAAVKANGASPGAPSPAAPASNPPPAPRPRPRRTRPTGDNSPIQINPVARSVNFERAD